MADEKIIQITCNNENFYILTSQGRIFQQNIKDRGAYDTFDGSWIENYTLPDLKQSKPRAQAEHEGYSEGFEELWNIYPKGNKGSKTEANRQYKARMKETEDKQYYQTHAKIKDGVVKYAEFIKATDQYMMHVSRFFGRDKHYLNDWTIPKQVIKKNALRLPSDNNMLEKFAIEHGLQRPGKLDTYEQYRIKLQAEINKRNES